MLSNRKLTPGSNENGLDDLQLWITWFLKGVRYTAAESSAKYFLVKLFVSSCHEIDCEITFECFFGLVDPCYF